MSKLEKLPKPGKLPALLLGAVSLAITVLCAVFLLSFGPSSLRRVSGRVAEFPADQWDFVSDTQAEHALPDDIGEEATLSVDCGWLYTEVWLRDAAGNETLLYDFTENLARENGQIAFLSLPEDTAGMTVLLRVSEGGRSKLESTLQRGVCCGTRGAAVWHFVGRRLYAPLLSILCSMSAVIALLVMALLRGKVGTGATDLLGVMALMLFDAGVWVLTDSRIVSLMLARPELNALISFVTFSLIPVLTLGLARRFLRGSYPLLLWVEFASGAVMAADLFAWRFLGWAMFSMVSAIHILIMIGAAAFLFYSVSELNANPNSELKYICGGFVMMALCSVAALAIYYLSRNSVYAVLYSVGVLSLVFSIMWATVRVQVRDYDEQVNLRAYKRMAYYDTLTGLNNRAAFTEAEKEWNTAKDWVYVMMDVNDLKKVNDHFGHTAGDALLRAAARSIAGAFDGIGQVYRIGGDEFVAVLHDTRPDRTEAALRALEQRCAAESEQSGQTVSIAVGYSMLDGRSMKPFELFAEADARMYRRKTEMKHAGQASPAAEAL